jgi:hypothetical protein
MKVTVIFVMNLFVLTALGDVNTRSKNRGKGSMWW